MTRFDLEHLYESNNLPNYKLKTTADLLKIHGIDHTAVKGYDSLDDVNRQLYAKFIVNLFNGLGLDSRLTMIPAGIYFVEDIDLTIPDGEYDLIVGGIVKAIDRTGKKRILHKWQDPEYKLKNIGTTYGSPPRTYLRFEYRHNGRKEWLHVMKEGEWY